MSAQQIYATSEQQPLHVERVTEELEDVLRRLHFVSSTVLATRSRITGERHEGDEVSPGENPRASGHIHRIEDLCAAFSNCITEIECDLEAITKYV